MKNKKQHGQFFTKKNPFEFIKIQEWIFSILNKNEHQNIVEPFAGNKDLFYSFKNNFNFKNNWEFYDIEPKHPDIIENDSIFNLKKDNFLIITNPPYLAKNSATRNKLNYPDTTYEDIYLLALEKMLANSEYVMAIIPESFITAGLFHQKLEFVISVEMNMFDDTDCPVCIACFNTHKKTVDFDIYRNDLRIGLYSELSLLDLRKIKTKTIIKNKDINFYSPLGEIGLIAIDNTVNASIKFVDGNLINGAKIKKTSRSLTRIKLDQSFLNIIHKYGFINFINDLNVTLNNHRDITSDLFLTSFKGLRKDGHYRRRLSFDIAKKIIEIELDRILQNPK